MAGILEIRRGTSGITLADGEFYLNKGINAVQIGSGSAILTLLPLNRLITGDIILNGNIYANNLTGSGALSTAITSNINVGGIEAGTTFPIATDFNTLWQQLLTGVSDATTSNLVLQSGAVPLSSGSREVGETFSFNRYVYNSAPDLSSNYAINGAVTMSGATNGTDFIYTGPSTLTPTVTILIGSTITPTRNTVGNITFTVNARKADNSANINPLVLNYPFRFRSVLAASATDVISNATAQTVYNSVVDSELIDSVVWSADCNNDNNDTTKFTYIIYPSSYATISTISKGASDVTTAFTLVGTYTITNAYSIAGTYRIYKSTQPGAYRSGDKLIIT